MSAFGRLYDVADELLDFVTAALSAAVAGYGAILPPHRYVANGGVVYPPNCELLVVQALPARTGVPGQFGINVVDAQTVLNADFAVHLIRCVPKINDQGSQPSDAAIDASAKIVLADAWTVLTSVTAGLTSTPPTLLTSCALASVSSLDGYGPEGGLAGSVLRLNVGL